MIVLERRPGERILIGDNIVIQVIDVYPGNRVRIGIEAPREIPVDRAEVRRSKERGPKP